LTLVFNGPVWLLSGEAAIGGLGRGWLPGDRAARLDYLHGDKMVKMERFGTHCQGGSNRIS
jgi:hypothetical protein